ALILASVTRMTWCLRGKTHLAPEEAGSSYRPGNPQRVHERLVMAGGDAIDESEVDGNGDDLESVSTGADDHLALQIEAIAAEANVAHEVRGVQAIAALRIGDAGPRRPGDGPGGESICQATPGQHLVEEVSAAADDQIGPRLFPPS